MIAHEAQPTATFSVSRRELLGGDALLGAAEIARAVCCRAEARLSVLAVTNERMRRIDGWLTPDAFVTHPVSADDADVVVGSVSARQYAVALIGAIAESLVGRIDAPPSPRPIQLRTVAGVSPGSMPSDVDWMIVLSIVEGAEVRRRLIASSPGGLVGAPLASVTESVVLQPMEPNDLSHVIEALVGSVQRPSPARIPLEESS